MITRILFGLFTLISSSQAVLRAETEFETNLITNPGAEDATPVESSRPNGTADFAGWTRSGNVFRNLYTRFKVTAVDGESEPFGEGYFLGGDQSESKLTQRIDLEDLDSAIDQGQVSYELQGWLGAARQSTQNVDQSELKARFLNESGEELGSTTLASPDAIELAVLGAPLGSLIHSVKRTETGTLPQGTRSIEIEISFDRKTGRILNASVDNLSFTLTNIQGR